MHYLKVNIIQLPFMVIAIVLLVYGLIIDCGLLMAISSGLAILVWFLDSFKHTQSSNKIEMGLDETNNRIEVVEENQKWEVL